MATSQVKVVGPRDGKLGRLGGIGDPLHDRRCRIGRRVRVPGLVATHGLAFPHSVPRSGCPSGPVSM